jgi:L-aspartate oxidase
LNTLIKYGVKFDQDENGYLRTLEGGHHQKIILHSGGDATGKGIMSALIYELLNRKNVTVLENEEVIKIKDEDNNKTIVTKTNKKFSSKTLVMALGGTGHMYKFSTNDKSITGDFIKLAEDASLNMTDIDSVQFHPTGTKLNDKGFLLSEALRGEGAYLVDENNNRFMVGKHELNELAPRDVVVGEMNKVEGQVYLDARHLNKDFLVKRFPTITAKLLESGFDLSQDLVPV